MAFDKSGRIFNASACGDNCAKWILKLGSEKDLPESFEWILLKSENARQERAGSKYGRGSNLDSNLSPKTLTPGS